MAKRMLTAALMVGTMLAGCAARQQTMTESAGDVVVTGTRQTGAAQDHAAVNAPPQIYPASPPPPVVRTR